MSTASSPGEVLAIRSRALSPPRPESPFARALREWVDDLKHKEDRRSPFYQQVLAVQQTELANRSRNGDAGLSGTTQTSAEACDSGAQRLAAFVADEEQKHRGQSWALRLGERLEPFIENLSQLMKLCATLTQSAPFEVSIAFVGAQLVLHLAKRSIDVFRRIVDIMEVIAFHLQCYKRISTAFARSEDMQARLVEAYKDIIKFWQRASKVLGRGFARTTVASVFQPIETEWRTYLVSLEDNARRVTTLGHAMTMEQKEEERKETLTDGFAKWLIGDEDASKLDYRADLELNQRTRHQGTCEWLFDHSLMKSWYDANSNSALWYNAPPGSGKTILSSAVVRYFRDRDRQVVYFRYSYDDSCRRKPLAALRAIALQLRRMVGNIPERAVSIFRQETGEHHAYALQDAKLASEVVLEFLHKIPRVHIVVDGLDECADVPGALELLLGLARASTRGLAKWFFTSRDEPVIRAAMKPGAAAEAAPAPGPPAATIFELRPERGVVMRDILSFIDARGREADHGRCATCVKHFTAASEENFLYSRLMFDILCGAGSTCTDEIHEELQRFPPGLSGCYSRCVDRISRLSNLEQELARRTIVFLVCAAQPLTLGDLRHALAIRLDGGKEYDDYKPGLVPKAERIQTILGSLIAVDGPLSDDQALIKFAHKSVPDFFRNPSRVKDISDHVRRFFVDERAGNLELGRHCLKYLQYQRYSDPHVDIDELMADARGEHAFLRYATAFWFQHLEDVDHNKALFATVRDFVRSTGFATYLAVQARVRPHLFARYTECGPGACGYSPTVRRHRLVARRFHGQSIDSRDDDDDDDDAISVPLPDWLDVYAPDGPTIIRAVCDYVREWHEVLLLSLPQRAPLDQEGRRVFPGLVAARDTDVRMSLVRALGEPPSSTSLAATNAALADIFFKKSKLHARLAVGGDSTTDWRWVEAPISSGEPCGEGPLQLTHGGDVVSSPPLIRFGSRRRDVKSESPTVWSVNPNSLAVGHYDGQICQTLLPDPTLQRALGAESSDGSWNILVQTASTADYGTAFAFQMSRRGVQDNETDSAYYSETYDSESSWSDSESDSDDDDDDDDGSSSSGGEGDNGNKLEDLECITDCLVVFCDDTKPAWIPLTDENTLLSSAFHPTRKLVAWSQSRCNVQLLDLQTGRIESQILEEPAAASGSATKTCREMRFSPCGRYLHYLLILFAPGEESESICRVFLSTYAFDDATNEVAGQPCSTTQWLTYTIGESPDNIPVPYTLSHWDEDNVYLCLPFLSCNPKIVRFDLKGIRAEPESAAVSGPDSVMAETATTHIRTLVKQIYFPSSTPARRPRLLYRTARSANKNDILVLALDARRLSDHSSDNDTTTTSSSSISGLPVVLEWKLGGQDSEGGTWRPWNEHIDSREIELAAQWRTYERLRGNFMSSDQRLKVVVRSGLNWTRKAFLSCM